MRGRRHYPGLVDFDSTSARVDDWMEELDRECVITTICIAGSGLIFLQRISKSAEERRSQLQLHESCLPQLDLGRLRWLSLSWPKTLPKHSIATQSRKIFHTPADSTSASKSALIWAFRRTCRRWKMLSEGGPAIWSSFKVSPDPEFSLISRFHPLR